MKSKTKSKIRWDEIRWDIIEDSTADHPCECSECGTQLSNGDRVIVKPNPVRNAKELLICMACVKSEDLKPA